MSDQVVGRDEDLQAAAAFLGAMAARPAGLVFAGEPGIGKTTLWTYVIGQARERSMEVLSARPAAAEARLAFAALADLLGSVPVGVVARLPEPQRHALAVALLREDAGGRRLDQRAVGAATVGILTEMSRAGPVIVAIDDLQWLDRPSARVLAFAARRLGGMPVGLLICERIGSEHEPGHDLVFALPESLADRRTLGPLGTTDLRRIVEVRLGRSLSRRALAQIGQVAGGNPFYAVEVARSLSRHPRPHGQAVVPIPGNLSGIVAARLAPLPDRARRALLPAAVLRSPTVGLVAAGMGAASGQSRRSTTLRSAPGISPWPPRRPTASWQRFSTRPQSTPARGERPRRRSTLPSRPSS